MLLVVECSYTWAILFFKFSLIMFFRPIMTLTWQRITLVIILVVNVAIGIAHFFMTVFQCGNPKIGDVFFFKKYNGQCASIKIVLGVGKQNYFSQAACKRNADSLLHRVDFCNCKCRHRHYTSCYAYSCCLAIKDQAQGKMDAYFPFLHSR
jgi:hypothetical protein